MYFNSFDIQGITEKDEKSQRSSARNRQNEHYLIAKITTPEALKSRVIDTTAVAYPLVIVLVSTRANHTRFKDQAC